MYKSSQRRRLVESMDSSKFDPSSALKKAVVDVPRRKVSFAAPKEEMRLNRVGMDGEELVVVSARLVVVWVSVVVVSAVVSGTTIIISVEVALSVAVLSLVSVVV